MASKVLLTGITGYVASHCAVELLKAGFSVRGSVRNIKKTDKIRENISKHASTDGKLEFCELNLLSDKGWDEAMKGCEYVLHVASPFLIAEPKDENEIIKPAVEGSLRALRFAKSNNIKKIVVTSSLVAMVGDKKKATLDQESWTNPEFDKVSAYMKSKTFAEKAVWDFYRAQDPKDKMEVTVVNPGPIYGPTITGNLAGESMKMIKTMMDNKMPQVPRCSYVMSDVRDIAKIHVAALTNEASNGQRFIVTTKDTYTFQDIGKILFEGGYEQKIPSVAPSFLLKVISIFDREVKGLKPFIDADIKADISPTEKIFNWKPIDFKKTILDSAESIKKVA